MPDGMMQPIVSQDELNARIKRLLAKRKHNDASVIEALKLLPLWDEYVETQPEDDETRGPLFSTRTEIEDIVYKTKCAGLPAVLASVEFILDEDNQKENAGRVEWQEQAVLKHVRDFLRTLRSAEGPAAKSLSATGAEHAPSLELRAHKIRTACTIVNRMVEMLLSPSNGITHSGMIDFTLEEEDVDALTWAALEATADSRDLYHWCTRPD